MSRCASALLLLVLAVPAAAQGEPRAELTYPLRQRVRVSSPALARALDARVARVDSSHLALTVTPAGSTVTVPLAAITSIESYGGRDRRKGMRRGALVGLALGAWLFVDAYSEVREFDYWGFGALSLGLVSFGIAPGLGAVAGYAFAPQVWTPLAAPAPTAPGGHATGIQFAGDEHVRLRTRGATLSGRVFSQTRTLVTVTTDDARVPVAWNDVQRVQVRGGKDRSKGALAGALVGIGIGILGEQSAPTTSTGERIGAFAGSALVFGYLGSRWLAPRGWSDLPIPRTTP